MALAIVGNDVVVSAYGPGGGDANQIVTAASALVEGVAALTEAMRLIVVGGAGNLEVAPGKLLVDTPDFPKPWKPLALAHGHALAVFRAAPANIDWTCACPAAFIEPGKRTGRYRTGTDQLVVDEGARGAFRRRISLSRSSTKSSIRDSPVSASPSRTDNPGTAAALSNDEKPDRKIDPRYRLQIESRSASERTQDDPGVVSEPCRCGGPPCICSWRSRPSL